MSWLSRSAKRITQQKRLMTLSFSTTPEMAAAQVLPLSIQVISDTICPFCYLGYRKLEKGLELLQNDSDVHVGEVKMKFEPFELDATLPEDRPVDKMQRLRKKYGPSADAMTARLLTLRDGYGIRFQPGGNLRNTVNSHRLLEHAHRQGGESLQRKLVDILFQGYFEQSKDIGDPSFLAASAVSAGVFDDEASAKAWLAGSEERDEVRKAIQKAQALGISGVPFTIVNNKYAISGAQEPETFYRLFKKVLTQDAVSSTATASACSADGKGAACA